MWFFKALFLLLLAGFGLADAVYCEVEWKPLSIAPSGLIVDLPGWKANQASVQARPEWVVRAGNFSAVVSTHLEKAPLGPARPYADSLADRYRESYPGDEVTTSPVTLEDCDAYRLDREQSRPRPRHYTTVVIVQGLRVTYLESSWPVTDSVAAACGQRMLSSLRYSPKEMLSLAVAAPAPAWAEVVGPGSQWKARLPGKPTLLKVTEFSPDWECSCWANSHGYDLLQPARQANVEAELARLERTCQWAGGRFRRLESQPVQGRSAPVYESVTQDRNGPIWTRGALIQIAPGLVLRLQCSGASGDFPLWEQFVQSVRLGNNGVARPKV